MGRIDGLLESNGGYVNRCAVRFWNKSGIFARTCPRLGRWRVRDRTPTCGL